MAQDNKEYNLKGVVEALLFINEKPVTMDQLKEVMDGCGVGEIKKAILELQQDYEDRRCGMVVMEIAGGYQMLSSPYYASYVRNFFKTRVKEKLSRPALEALAIIAYKQPVSRGDVELIRGVNSDGVVLHLFNKSLVKIVGRRDVPGRPYLYGTTKLFLEYFGLKALSDLPKLEEFPALMNDMVEPSEIISVEDEVTVPVEEETAPAPLPDQLEQVEPAEDILAEKELLSTADIVEQQPVQDAAEGQASVVPEQGPFQEEDPVELKEAMDELAKGGQPTTPGSDGQDEHQDVEENHLDAGIESEASQTRLAS